MLDVYDEMKRRKSGDVVSVFHRAQSSRNNLLLTINYSSDPDDGMRVTFADNQRDPVQAFGRFGKNNPGNVALVI